MLARCRLPTVSPKADTVKFSAALGLFGECLENGETPDEHVEEETVNIPRRNYAQHRTCNSIYTQYPMTQKLGACGFGSAYLGENVNSKLVRCIKQSKGPKRTIRYAVLHFEIDILKTLDHPNILKVHESLEELDGYLYAAMEYCDGGDLERHMKQTFAKNELLSEAYIARIMKQIVQAVAYLHRRNILHKDLKLDNVMLDESKGYAKLIEFGLSEQLADSNGKSKIRGGTPRYMPPEALYVSRQLLKGMKHKVKKKVGVTLKADIWALGIMIYAMATGSYLPGYKTPVALLKNAPPPPLPVSERYNIYSDELHDLVAKMLKWDPKKRPSAEECLQHPFFKNVPDEEIDVAEEQTILDTLKTFSDESQLYAALSNLVQHELGIDNSDPVVKLFKKIDTNDDGELSTEELQNYLNAHGWNTDDIDSLLRVADVDGNGHLEISEFVTACRVWQKEDENALLGAFCNLDIDDKGSFGLDELKSIANLGDAFDSAHGRFDKKQFLGNMLKTD